MAKQRYVYSKDNGSFLQVTADNSSMVQSEYKKNPDNYDLLEVDNESELENYKPSEVVKKKDSTGEESGTGSGTSESYDTTDKEGLFYDSTKDPNSTDFINPVQRQQQEQAEIELDKQRDEQFGGGQLQPTGDLTENIIQAHQQAEQSQIKSDFSYSSLRCRPSISTIKRK